MYWKIRFLAGEGGEVTPTSLQKGCSLWNSICCWCTPTCSPMPADSLRVSIEEVVDEDARLPFPVSDEIETVGSALGTHVAWPSHLVVAKSHEKKNGKQVSMGNQDLKTDFTKALPPSLLALYCLFKNSFKDNGLRIILDVELFGQDVNLYILMKDDLLPFCNMEPITGSCIIAYIWHLYSSMQENGTTSKFLFVNPFVVEHGVNREDRSRALSERLLLATSNQLVFVPCNVGGHWILTIIQVDKNQVFLMDPLYHRNKDNVWKCVVEAALSIVHAKKQRNKMKKASWEVIKGPLQPDNKQCGYYVMRFMREIMTGFEKATASSFQLSSLFKDVKTYSQAQLNMVREEWATCVIKHALDC